MMPRSGQCRRDPRALHELNAWLAERSVQERVDWALSSLRASTRMSSSFGAQSPRSCIWYRAESDIPVILDRHRVSVFPETYRLPIR